MNLAGQDFVPNSKPRENQKTMVESSKLSSFPHFEEEIQDATIVEEFTEGMDTVRTFSDGTFEISSNDEHGLVEEGRHYTEYVEHVKALKRANKHQEAIAILLKILGAVENEALVAGQGWGVAPWYYEQLAIIYRKEGLISKEIEVLERYMGQEKAPGPRRFVLEKRLTDAKAKFGV